MLFGLNVSGIKGLLQMSAFFQFAVDIVKLFILTWSNLIFYTFLERLTPQCASDSSVWLSWKALTCFLLAAAARPASLACACDSRPIQLV